MLRNARMLLQRVNDLLDASKLEAGAIALSYHAVDLAHLVEVVGATFESRAADAQVRFTVEAGVAVPAEVDPDRVFSRR